jgi:O-antigen/teichoic acid export membrane protein
LTSVYVVPVVLFGKPITKILYGAGYYVDFVQLLPWLGAVAIIESMGYGLGIGLKVLERSNSLFWAQLIGTIFTFSLGLYLIWKFGLYGAALGTFLALFLIMIVESCFLWNQLRQA